MYVFEAMKRIMLDMEMLKRVYTVDEWDQRRNIRGIELNDLTEYSKTSHVFSIEWRAHFVHNTYEIFELRTSNAYSFKKLYKLFSRVRPGRYTNSDGTQVLRE